MSKQIHKALPELLEAGIINEKTAEEIHQFYKKAGSKNYLLTIFSILGAMLLGLGIILLIAHNWDKLARGIQIAISFLPLVLGQVACAYSRLRKVDNTGWKEGSSIFLVFAIGSSISLISQIYNIPGSMSSLLLTWILLALPVVYIMWSSMASLLVHILVGYYACQVGYIDYPNGEPYLYLPFLLALIPYYYLLIKRKPESNFTYFHHWFITASVLISMGAFNLKSEEMMLLAYMALLGNMYLLGQSKYFASTKIIANPLKLIGMLGMLGVLMVLSFEFFWIMLEEWSPVLPQLVKSNEFILAMLFTIISLVYLYNRIKTEKEKDIQDVFPFVYLAFVLIFIMGLCCAIPARIAINILIFGIGLFVVLQGAKANHLGQLNFGLIIITVLVICRFFDEDISFTVRGILFMSIGLGFFFANHQIIKKRKTTEDE